MKKTIGFIGGGNMASAIIKGMVSSKLFSPDEICVTDRDLTKAEELAEKTGVNCLKSNEELLEKCSAVVIAVKPIAMPDMLTSLRDVFSKEKNLVISIAAGQSIEKIHGLIGCDLPIIRVMPNINAIAGEAMSGYAVNDSVGEDDIVLLEKVLNSTGKSVKIDEEMFSVYSAMAGCSPAYVYDFINTVSELGVKYGLYKADALKIVSETVLNTAKEMIDGDIKENVNAEISGSEVNVDENFSKAIEKCLQSAVDKDRRI